VRYRCELGFDFIKYASSRETRPARETRMIDGDWRDTQNQKSSLIRVVEAASYYSLGLVAC